MPRPKALGRSLPVGVTALCARAAHGSFSSSCALDTAFRQQRLKAWQPILTPKTVLPTLFLVGIIFAPIGGLLVWGSNKVSMITLDYTDCDTKASSSFSNLPHSTYDLRSSDSGFSHTPPQWSFTNNTSNPPATQAQCTIRFNVPADLQPPVFLYYKLTNFYQNHRRYVKSYDPTQLRGEYKSASSLNKGDCKPLAEINGQAIYPCGLIANSIFNGQLSQRHGSNQKKCAHTPSFPDTFTLPTLIGDSSNTTYNFTDKGIAWPGEAKKYTNKPGYSNLSEIVPPPNWVLRYGPTWNSSNIPALKDDEHFQNWMRTAGLPTFTKLYYRNDNETLTKGDYEITIYMSMFKAQRAAAREADMNMICNAADFPVTKYGGTKSIVISTISWIGGKNPFMGWAYVATACLFVALGLAGTIRHLMSPRYAVPSSFCMSSIGA